MSVRPLWYTPDMFFKKKQKPESKFLSPWRECRSWYGISIHIRSVEDESGKALCGYDPLDDFKTPLTMEYFLRAKANPHAGFRYCTDCADKFEAVQVV